MAKRKEAHEHHGGAWKVAYSDFITSMMALFMVLWILSQNIQVRESIQQYFLDPFTASVPRSPGLAVSETNQPTQPKLMTNPPRVAIDQKILWELAKKFYDRLHLDIEDVEKPVDISLTDDGMFITIYNRDDQPIFVHGTTEFTKWGRFVMENISWLLDDAGLPVKIASHVEAGLKLPEHYSDWELTTDMSNAVRKALVRYALPEGRIHRITGYGSSQPVASLTPEDRRNQRIELELNVPGTDKGKEAPTPVPASHGPSYGYHHLN